MNGYRHTTTLPAGADGNEKPIISTSETWHSDELNEVLERIEISPWMGKHTVAVRNIQLGEPDPAAFQIPSDYAIREIGQNPVRVEDP